MMLQVARQGFGDRPPAHGFARAMDCLAIAADEIVPLRQRFTGGAQPVGAGSGQPADFLQLARGQPHAIRHESAPLAVIAATRGVPVEQPARNIGRIDAPGVGILDLVQATFAAAVAQSLPLRPVERLERLFPEVHCT